MYRLKQELNQVPLVSGDSCSATPKDNRDFDSVASVNFFLDDTGVLVDGGVDLSQRPPRAVADRLVDCYFQIVHPTFPIVGKVIFLRQYRKYYSNALVIPGKRWLAILNLMFALATKYSQLVHEGTEEDILDSHSVYFSRAWELGLSDAALLDHPNLQQVQVEGLASFYFLSVGQINRYVLSSPPTCYTRKLGLILHYFI